MRNKTTNITLFNCTNCFNQNTVTIKAHWLQWSITAALKVTLALTLGAGAIALYIML